MEAELTHKNNKLYLYTLVLAAIMILVPNNIWSVSADGTSIDVQPATTTVAYVGLTFNINITISQVTDLAGWDFQLYYPNSLLNATKLMEGPFLKQAGSTFNVTKSFSDSYNATHGRIWFACTLTGQGPGANGNGVLATVTFKTKSGGDGILHLGDTDLVDSAYPPNHIPRTTNDGTVHVTVGTKDLAVASVNPSKTVVGDIYTVPINVTVENQGSYGVFLNVTLNASRPLVSVVNITLYGSTSYGWGYTAETMTIPGPTIAVNEGDLVNLTLISIDLATHNFFVDYNGNTMYDLGEPKSADFCCPPYWVPSLNYQFIAGTLGAFTYYCQYRMSVMYGAFVVTAPPVSNVQIGKQTIFLNSGASADLTFNWATADFARAPYDIIGYACPLTEETDLTDNIFSYSVVKITIPGDVNGDWIVNILDATQIGLWWQKLAPPAPANVDINGNGLVNIQDATIIGLNWQKHA